MTYRHIFFTGKSILSGYGQMTIYYTGRIYTNAVRMVNFKSLYDPSKDLVITCSDCARKKYKTFVKIREK
jgi:hypothetical protein